MASSTGRNEVLPSYEVTLREDVVWASMRGKVDLELRREMLTAALAQARHSGLNRVVFDFRLARFANGIVGMHECVKLMAQSELPHNACFALLCSHRTADIDYLETTCINQGINLTVFTDGEEAVHWLEGAA
ncbi:MAG TPA: hypothetical protein VMI92_07230 [Steroidobacteraceae bacterium]|nr:hypothetical protein [Steroidobacteraceae bacterium]